MSVFPPTFRRFAHVSVVCKVRYAIAVMAYSLVNYVYFSIQDLVNQPFEFSQKQRWLCQDLSCDWDSLMAVAEWCNQTWSPMTFADWCNGQEPGTDRISGDSRACSIRMAEKSGAVVWAQFFRRLCRPAYDVIWSPVFFGRVVKN